MANRPGLPGVGYASLNPAAPQPFDPVDSLELGFQDRTFQPIWDRQTIASTDTSTVFFNATKSNRLLGNIEQPGTLPEPQTFVGRGICVQMDPAITLADARLLIDGGLLTMTINDIKAFESPIQLLGGGTQLQASGSGAAATEQLSAGVADWRAMLWFPVPFVINAREFFTVRVDWTAISGLAASRDVTVILLGLLSKKATK